MNQQQKRKSKKKKKGYVFNSYDIKTISSLLFSGGRICVSHNDSFFVSPCDKTVNFIEYSTGEVIHTLKDFEHEILSLTLSHDDRKLAVSLGNGDVQIYSTVNNRVTRVLHFSSPCVQSDFDPTSPLLALGFGNGQVRVYHITKSQVIYTYDNHVGRIGIVRFHPKEWYLISSSLNGLVVADIEKNYRNSSKNKREARFRNHRGVVLGVCFVNEDLKTMITTAVDKMFCVYSLESMTLLKKFPAFEDVVDIQTIPKEWLVNSCPSLMEISPDYRRLPDTLILAGSRIGNITIWDYNHQNAVWKYQPNKSGGANNSNNSNNPSFQFSYIIRSKREVLFTTEECNFSIFSFLPKQPLVRSRQILGFDEEILDVSFINKTHFVTATTGSEDVVIFNSETKDCRTMSGHTGIILALACSHDGKFVLSGGKDRTSRIWHVPSLRCCGVMDSHTDSVTCVAFSRNSSFFVTGSDDRTIKVYLTKEVTPRIIQKQTDIPNDNNNNNQQQQITPINFVCQFFAHSKGVTGIDISPDGNFIATCSSDKNVKIFRVIRKKPKKLRSDSDSDEDSDSDSDEEDLLLDSPDDMRLEMFRYMKHPKGVCCVRFSVYEKVLATGGADHQIRIFSVESGSCVKVLEGHNSSILKLEFVNHGTQMISASSRGLVKLWVIKMNTCLKTWEAHEGGIWGMDISREGREGRKMLTCGEDGKILCWEENSEVILGMSVREKKEQVEKIQKLDNLLRNKEYGEALVLSIELDQPRRTYKILETMMQLHLTKEIDEIVRKRLGAQEVNFLFQYCVDWNTNSRYCLVAHTILNSFFRQYNPNFVGWNYEKSLDSLLVYGEKHIKRLENLVQGSFVLDYTLQHMNVVDSSVVSNEKKKKEKEKVVEEEEEEDEEEEVDEFVSESESESDEEEEEMLPPPPPKKKKSRKRKREGEEKRKKENEGDVFSVEEKEKEKGDNEKEEEEKGDVKEPTRKKRKI